MTNEINIFIIILVEMGNIMKSIDCNLSEWYEIVEPILSHKEFQKRKEFLHHGEISVYDHVINVSMVNYKWAKKLGLDYKSAAIAGLLHDFYETPWTMDTEHHPFFQKHGFTHARSALNNSRKYFGKFMNKTVENSILRHMFPLNIVPPKYKEGWLLTLADKYVSMEVMLEPKFFKDLLSGVIGR